MNLLKKYGKIVFMNLNSNHLSRLYVSKEIISQTKLYVLDTSEHLWEKGHLVAA